MKHISTLLLAATMLFGTASFAQAVDIKAKGQFEFGFGWGENLMPRGDVKKVRGFDSHDATAAFFARQRVRTQINFIASEALQGVLLLEIGDTNWGRSSTNNTGSGAGGALDADGVNVKTKRAYIDWIVPNTDLSIRMGIQGMALPGVAGFNNPVLSADVAGITASYQFNEMFGLTTFWARPFDAYAERDDNGRKLDDSMDMFGLVAPVKGNGWAVTPWAVLASIGNKSGFMEYAMESSYGNYFAPPARNADGTDRSTAWWAGTNVELTMLDPWVFGADIMYGHMGRLDTPQYANGVNSALSNGPSLGYESMQFSGWFLDAKLDYKMDWATAGFFGWWSTGDKGSDVRDGKFGRMMAVGTDTPFGPTSFGFGGKQMRGIDAAIGCTGLGTWGLGVQLANISFIEDLSHTLRLAYYSGTNRAIAAQEIAAHGGVGQLAKDLYMTTRDNAWEVNIDHQYKIYENLTAFVETGYINLDSSTSNPLLTGKSDAWKGQVGFKYEF